MKLKLTLFFLLFSTAFITVAQNHFTISGYITDASSAEILIGANVALNYPSTGTVTNNYGYYSLTLPEDEYTLYISYVGYEPIQLEIKLENDQTQNIKLDIAKEFMQEVEVIGGREKEIERNEFSLNKLSIAEIRKMPTVFGEPDVIKAMQLKPGIKTIGDGSSAMFVRGGGSDQNLIMIDEAPIYNPSHLFGLISVFNVDAIKHVNLYKSNMPAQYGGRVSAVMDTQMKDGNLNKNNFSLGLSPFAATISANGPIQKDKTSYLLSLRKSLIDMAFSPGSNLPLVPSFYDINAKFSTKLNDKNKLFLTLYNGQDRIRSVDGLFNEWGNSSATLRWNTQLNKKFFSNLSFIYSRYDNSLEFEDESRNYSWKTGLYDSQLKWDITYFHLPNNTVKFGGAIIDHQFIPGKNGSQPESSIPEISALEYGFYALQDLEIFEMIGVNYGIRLSGFQNYGYATFYSYNEAYSVTDTMFNHNGVYHNNWNLEPRLSINYKITDNKSIKASYSRNAQYMQILQNNALSYTSLETWFPVNRNINPLLVDALGLGFFQSLKSGYFLSVETYYKKIQNQIDYVDHAQIVNNPFVEGEVRSGSASAYGAELLLKKETGRLTGNISYTYSRAIRTVQDINDGNTYSAPFDIPHDLRVLGQYKLNKKWDISSIWMYMSGRPVTLPIGFYMENNDPVPIYSERNGARFPSYHRLDISANYSTKQSGISTYWDIIFGLFNAYGRKNPLGYDFRRKIGNRNELAVYQYVLFRWMPNFSLKYNF
ncbi:TonB-dependent receptor [Marivirga tractuosa]|uniref:TonB-dependent receptor n=1 Tax=Marivirga tractuosa TaxID=1006 RepID=UPI0035CE8679